MLHPQIQDPTSQRQFNLQNCLQTKPSNLYINPQAFKNNTLSTIPANIHNFRQSKSLTRQAITQKITKTIPKITRVEWYSPQRHHLDDTEMKRVLCDPNLQKRQRYLPRRVNKYDGLIEVGGDRKVKKIDKYKSKERLPNYIKQEKALRRFPKDRVQEIKLDKFYPGPYKNVRIQCHFQQKPKDPYIMEIGSQTDSNFSQPDFLY